eukprot:gene14828-biopygen12607
MTYPIGYGLPRSGGGLPQSISGLLHSRGGRSRSGGGLLPRSGYELPHSGRGGRAVQYIFPMRGGGFPHHGLWKEVPWGFCYAVEEEDPPGARTLTAGPPKQPLGGKKVGERLGRVALEWAAGKPFMTRIGGCSCQARLVRDRWAGQTPRQEDRAVDHPVHLTPLCTGSPAAQSIADSAVPLCAGGARAAVRSHTRRGTCSHAVPSVRMYTRARRRTPSDTHRRMRTFADRQSGSAATALPMDQLLSLSSSGAAPGQVLRGAITGGPTSLLMGAAGCSHDLAAFRGPVQCSGNLTHFILALRQFRTAQVMSILALCTDLRTISQPCPNPPNWMSPRKVRMGVTCKSATTPAPFNNPAWDGSESQKVEAA